MTRAERLSKLIVEKELDQLFISDLVNVRYLTGFTGTNGACLVSADERIFFTDFRYTERAASEVASEWERPDAERELIPQIVARMKGRVGFEDAKLSVRQLARLEAAAGDDVEFAPAGDLVEQLRAVKEPEELERIVAAAKLSDEVYEWALERGLGGHTERDIAQAVEGRIRELGAEPSFPPIVATAEDGALPHAEPGDRQVGSGELVVFDMGSELDGYCSDCTRTFAVGEPDDEVREVYELVLRAQQAALEAVRPTASGKEVDAVAREIISEAGYGDRFGHGLGHGVGMEVHEGPRLSTTSEDDLFEGNVVTVEPGV
jgi:Xaa-Pro aminopeptidase